MRTHESSESGLTLIEMLVTTVLITLVGGLVFNAVLTLNRAVAVADNVTFDQGFGRNALTLVSRDIRAAAPIQQSAAPAFRTAEPRVVEFTALLDQGLRPQLIRVEIDAESQLLVTSIQPEATSVAPALVYKPADRQERYIASFVVNPGEIFRYFDADGCLIGSGDTETTPGCEAAAGGPGPGGGAVTGDERREIAAVEMSFMLNRAPILTDASEVQLTVRLPNAGANN